MKKNNKIMKIKKYIFLAIVPILIVLHDSAYPDQEFMPLSYKEEMFCGGRYIFVMRPPESFRHSEKKMIENPKPWRKLDPTLLEYPFSGLYPDDKSFKPIWTIDWYAYQDEVYIGACNRKYLVRMEHWANVKFSSGGEKFPDENEPAVAFYESGKLLKRYLVKDLISNFSSLPMTTSHYLWKESVRFDDLAGRFIIYTFTKERIVFDIKSGEILEHGTFVNKKTD